MDTISMIVHLNIPVDEVENVLAYLSNYIEEDNPNDEYEEPNWGELPDWVYQDCAMGNGRED